MDHWPWASSFSNFVQKPPRGVLLKSYSKKFRNIHRKKLELESPSNKVTGLQAFNSIMQRLQHRYFLVNIDKFLRTLILKDICERPPLFAYVKRVIILSGNYKMVSYSSEKGSSVLHGRSWIMGFGLAVIFCSGKSLITSCFPSIL